MVSGQCHGWRDEMIKLQFPDDGGIAFQFPKPKNKQHAECLDRVGAIIKGLENPDPTLALTLGIAALNGPKTFERAARYFNVA